MSKSLIVEKVNDINKLFNWYTYNEVIIDIDLWMQDNPILRGKILKAIKYEFIKVIFKKRYDFNILEFNKNDKILSFNNCVFEEELWFYAFIFKGNIEINNCEFKKDLVFKNSILKKRLTIIDSNIDWNLKIENINNLNELIISWRDNKSKINNLILDKLYISNKETSIFILSNLNIKNELVFSNSNILPEKIIFKNIYFELLKFIDIDLWKTTFNWVQIKKIYLENATLNDCIFNWVEFPKNYELEKNYIIDDKCNKSKNLSNKQLKDNYRQLKHVMDKNWNYTEANKFFEKEMDYYERELKEKSFFNQERIILFFQKWISYFWKSWLVPILWIFVLAFITAFINLCYLDFKIDNNHIDLLKNIKWFIKLFFNLLYPLYWLKKDYIDWLDVWLILWFIIYKTLYWILLWHLVVALKRTTKR